jgi:hypothetical protein
LCKIDLLVDMINFVMQYWSEDKIEEALSNQKIPCPPRTSPSGDMIFLGWTKLHALEGHISGLDKASCLPLSRASNVYVGIVRVLQ